MGVSPSRRCALFIFYPPLIPYPLSSASLRSIPLCLSSLQSTPIRLTTLHFATLHSIPLHSPPLCFASFCNITLCAASFCFVRPYPSSLQFAFTQYNGVSLLASWLAQCAATTLDGYVLCSSSV